jgi:hypothetical protein
VYSHSCASSVSPKKRALIDKKSKYTSTSFLESSPSWSARSPEKSFSSQGVGAKNYSVNSRGTQVDQLPSLVASEKAINLNFNIEDLKKSIDQCSPETSVADFSTTRSSVGSVYSTTSVLSQLTSGKKPFNHITSGRSSGYGRIAGGMVGAGFRPTNNSFNDRRLT